LPHRGVQPFLRWAGSKRQLLPILARYWNGKYDRYVEPFVGSACLFFHIAPSKALLGDLNAELIGTLRELKRNPGEISARLKELRKGRKRYLAMRRIDPGSISAPERAARFIYLNRVGYLLYSGRPNILRCGTREFSTQGGTAAGT